MIIKKIKNLFNKNYKINDFFSENKVNIIYFFIIFILIINSLSPYIYSNGYFLSSDFIYGPEIDLIYGQYYPNYILWINLQKFLSILIPNFLVQKIIFLGCFFIGLYSINKLLKYFYKDNFLVFLGTIFFLFSPFVFPRLTQGHIYILYAYMLLPLFLSYLLQKKYLYSAIFGGLILSLSPHFIFILLSISIVYLIIFFKDFIKNINLKTSFFCLIIILLINSYWIYDITNHTNINNFNQNDLDFFSSKSVYFSNIYFEILSLNGFWVDELGRYEVKKTIFNYIFLIIIYFFGILGLKKLDKNKLFFAILGIIAFILSIGVSENNIFINFNKFLFENIPFYIGLRESNKFSVILIISIIFLFLKGIEIIFNKYNYKILKIMFLILILSYQPIFNLIKGGNLKAYNYTSNRYEIKNIIDYSNFKNNCEYKKIGFSNCYQILFLPWEQTIFTPFIGNYTMNLGGVFFGKNTLIGDNIGIKNTYSQSNKFESKIIQNYLVFNLGNNFFIKKEINKNEIIQKLNNLGIQYIILSKTIKYYEYHKFLNKLLVDDLIEIKKENHEFILYKIKKE